MMLGLDLLARVVIARQYLEMGGRFMVVTCNGHKNKELYILSLSATF